MGKYEVTLPAMGEGIIEATITRWFLVEGQFIYEDQPLLEVATDKVDSEIPSPLSGIIKKIIYQEGEIPKIGEVIALIEGDIKGENDEKKSISESESMSNGSENSEIRVEKSNNNEYAELYRANRIVKSDRERINQHYTPFVRNMAKNRGITRNELSLIPGTGAGGRITKDDLNKYIQSDRPFSVRENKDFGHQPGKNHMRVEEKGDKYIPAPGEELVEMDRTRKLIAERMIQSKRISPHVTSAVEIDVTDLVNWRNEHGEAFKEKHKVKLTYTPLIVLSIVKALKVHTGINVSVSGDHIVRKRDINIGVAIALPDGNLIVPVIKNADMHNFVSLALQVADFALRAREGNLLPSEVQGGTFTLTNIGSYDNIWGTPVINQPEVAILAAGAIRKKPGVVYINGQHTLGIRDVVVLSLTYDHRVVDGALGGSFLKSVGENMETIFPGY